VNHHTTPGFWRLFDRLPHEVQQLARKNYELLKKDPKHPSLHLKQVKNMWSVRVGAHYRAVGTDHHGYILWFWIGSHAEYDRLIG